MWEIILILSIGYGGFGRGGFYNDSKDRKGDLGVDRKAAVQNDLKENFLSLVEEFGFESHVTYTDNGKKRKFKGYLLGTKDSLIYIIKVKSDDFRIVKIPADSIQKILILNHNVGYAVAYLGIFWVPLTITHGLLLLITAPANLLVAALNALIIRHWRSKNSLLVDPHDFNTIKKYSLFPEDVIEGLIELPDSVGEESNRSSGNP